MLQKLIALLIILFPIALFADDNQPLDSIKKLPPAGTVALTFDDGPNPIYTRQILAILKKNNIKATFFVVGTNAKLYPDVIKEIHEQGHIIGSHSQTHPMLTKLSESQLQNEITKPSEIIVGIIGIKPLCLRYPFGASNEHVRDAIRAHGMQPTPMGWNTFDYDRPGVQKIVDQALKGAHSRQVILMHDGYDKRQQTVAALPIIIEEIKKKGLGFSPICG